jgi:hypothetical protein
MNRNTAWFRIAIALVIITALLSLFDPAQTVASTSRPSSECDAGLAQRVIDPARLQVVENCVTVTGTVRSVVTRGPMSSADGGYRFLIELDPQYRPMLNSLNKLLQRGNLMVEVACAEDANQATATCSGFRNRVTLPNVGERVAVTGSYVFNPLQIPGGKLGWMEINPASKIEPTE